MASVQSDMSRDIALAQQNASSVAVGLDGRTHKGDELAAALRALDPLTPVDGCDKFCRAVDGLAQPNSLTGILEVADLDGNVTRLFLKKVTAAAMAHKGWNDRRRSLLYARNELRIYREFPELAARGVGHPRVLRLTDGLSALDEERLGGDVGAEPPTEALSSCGVILWLEPVVGYSQLSPLAPKQAAVVLRAAARLHAATWEDAALLTRSADRLQHPGGSFALAIRNPAELDRIEQNWETFKRNFREAAPVGFFRAPGIAALGARVRRAAPWVAAQLAPAPNDAHACLVHGDLKAMNVFLPANDDGDALLIDFASTGVGLGMADVAMHLTHALRPADLSASEDALLADYLAALGKPNYDAATARRHYELGTIDYGRFVLGRFWGAASPESFEAKATKENVALVHRDVDSALAFIARLDTFLARFEPEM